MAFVVNCYHVAYPTKTDECKFRVGRGSTGHRSYELDSSNKPYETKKTKDYCVSLWVGASAHGLHFRIFQDGENMNTARYIETSFQIDAFSSLSDWSTRSVFTESF